MLHLITPFSHDYIQRIAIFIKHTHIYGNEIILLIIKLLSSRLKMKLQLFHNGRIPFKLSVSVCNCRLLLAPGFEHGPTWVRLCSFAPNQRLCESIWTEMTELIIRKIVRRIWWNLAQRLRFSFLKHVSSPKPLCQPKLDEMGGRIKDQAKQHLSDSILHLIWCLSLYTVSELWIWLSFSTVSDSMSSVQQITVCQCRFFRKLFYSFLLCIYICIYINIPNCSKVSNW